MRFHSRPVLEAHSNRPSPSQRGTTVRRRAGRPFHRLELLEDRTLMAAALDPGFGEDGRVSVPFTFANLLAADVAVDAQGRIVAVGTVVRPVTGNEDFVVARYLPDGSLDPEFSGDGLTTIAFDLVTNGADRAEGVVIDGEGRIVVVGSTNPGGNNLDFAVARLMPDGRPDNGFSGDGRHNFSINAGDTARARDVAIDGEDRLVVVGSVRGAEDDFAVARLMPDGVLDESFGGGDGLVRALFDQGGADDDVASAVSIQTDGKIVVAGTIDIGAGNTDFGVIRLNLDGGLDGTFNTGGALPDGGVRPGQAHVAFDLGGAGSSLDRLADMQIDSQGRIVLAGTVQRIGLDFDYGVARLAAAGTLDPAFGTADSGKRVIAINRTANGIDDAIALSLIDDAPLIAGTVAVDAGNSEIALTRLSATGEPVADYGDGGTATFANSDGARALALVGDEALVLGEFVSATPGINNFLLIRAGTDGSPSAGFGESGRVETPFGFADGAAADVVVDAEGRYVIVGTFNFAVGDDDLGVTRLNADGTLDTTFGGDGRVTAFNFDGFGDTNERATAVVIDDGGNILVAGTSDARGTDDFALLRFLPNGDLDPTFGGGDGVRLLGDFPPFAARDERAVDLAVVPGTGAIVVVGTAAGPDGGPDFGVVRLNGDGTTDTSFSTDGFAFVDFGTGGATNPETVAAVAVQDDGKVVIVGGTTQSGSNADFAVARLDADGTLDIPFGTEGRTIIAFDRGGNNADVAADVAVDGEGRIVVVGTVTVGTTDRDFALTRLSSTGQLDTSFGTGGRVTVAFNRGGGNVDEAAGLALSGTGIVVVGTVDAEAGATDLGVARLSADGVPDAGFGPDGAASFDFNLGGDSDDVGSAVAVLDDGRILAVGSAGSDTPAGGTYFAALRLLVDSTAPTIVGVDPVSPDPRRDPVESIDVTFSEPIDLGTFTAADLALTRDGVEVELGGDVTIELVTGSTYRIGGLGGLTAEDGTYTLTVDAAGISDPSGNAGTGTADDTFAVDLAGPTIDAVGPVDPDPRRDPVASVDVAFSEPIDVATFTADDLRLTRDGDTVDLGDDVTIELVSGSTYRVNGLGGPTGQGGTYVLTVDATGVVDELGNPGLGTASETFTIDDVAQIADFDGDGRTDFATYTVTGGVGRFEIRLSTNPDVVADTLVLGGLNDFPITGDYDGDGLADVAVYGFDAAAGFSTYRIRRSSDGLVQTTPFGGPFDFPVAGDYDGDGRTDIAVYGFSPDNGFSRFAILLSGGGNLTQGFGGGGDTPVAGDFDGDGTTDLAVYGFSPDNGFSRFGVVYSTGRPTLTFPFGGADDRPLQGDFDGDGLADLAVFGFSPNEGFARFGVVSSSGQPTRSVPFGGADDRPVAGDYDGDGTTDLAVYGFSPANGFARFGVVNSSGAPTVTLASGVATSLGLPPFSGLFRIQASSASRAALAAGGGAPRSMTIEPLSRRPSSRLDLDLLDFALDEFETDLGD